VLFFGNRADPTAKVARAVRRFLAPDETVLAGLHVQRPGTAAAELSGAVRGAVAGAVGNTTFVPGGASDPKTNEWLKHVGELGIDPKLAQRTLRMHFVLTDRRFLLIRRSRLTGRVREMLAAWPLSGLERIRVHRGSRDLRLTIAGVDDLRLELPNDHRFLPEAYREVPKRLAAARKAL